MLHQEPTVRKFFFNILLPTFILVFATNTLSAQDGKALFQANCASCHSPIKVVTGPALKGVTSRVPDQKLLHAWIKNNIAVLSSGNKYFNDLYVQFSKTPMNTFPNLTDPEIDAILKYVESVPEPGKGPTPTPTAGKEEESDNTLLYGVLTLILAVITLILLQVNSNLKKLSDDKEGIPATEPIPFYRIKCISHFWFWSCL